MLSGGQRWHGVLGHRGRGGKGVRASGVDWAASDTKGFRGRGASSLLRMPSVRGVLCATDFKSNS